MMKFKNSHISNHPSRTHHSPVTSSADPRARALVPVLSCPCPTHSNHYFDWLYPVTPGNRF